MICSIKERDKAPLIGWKSIPPQHDLSEEQLTEFESSLENILDWDESLSVL